MTKTIRDFLVETFGDSALEIDGLDDCGECTFYGVNLTLNGHGALYVQAGGECLMTFERRVSPTSLVRSRPVYLKRCTEAHDAGQRKRSAAQRKAQDDRANMTAEDWKDFHAPTPPRALRANVRIEVMARSIVIKNNTVTNNGGSGIVLVKDSADVVFEANSIEGNSTGAVVGLPGAQKGADGLWFLPTRVPPDK